MFNRHFHMFNEVVACSAVVVIANVVYCSEFTTQCSVFVLWFFCVYTLTQSSPQKALKLVTVKAQSEDEKSALLALTVSQEMVVVVCA